MTSGTKWRAIEHADGAGTLSDVPAARVSRYPMADLADGLAAWSRSPDDDEAGAFTRIIQPLLRATEARGAFLDVTARPLPAFEAGFGTLESRPAAGSESDSESVRRYDLSTQDRRTSIATLWLDAPSDAAVEVVRVLELALDAALSRLEVLRTMARLAALDNATRAIAGELDLDRVLQLMVDSVRELIESRYAALGIVDPNGRIERFITSGISPDARARIGAPPRGHGLLGTIIREGRSLRIPDIAAHADTYGFPAHHPPMHSFLGVPVQVGGRPIGNFYLTEKLGAGEFDAGDQELVETFALHAGIAIQNARLHQRVQELAIVDERVRISRDLHDGIIQGIYAVGLSLEDVPDLMSEDRSEAVNRVDRAIDRLHMTIRDIRTFIVGLGSSPDASLASALEGVVAEMPTEGTMTLELNILDAAEIDGRLSEDATHELLQIAREALSNIARHSQARRASLSLALDGPNAVLTVEDDGRGFDRGRPAGPGHFGLANLRDRAAAVGGQLEIESEPGNGTRIIVRLPLSEGESPSS